MASSKVVAEYAKSSRSSCKKCAKKIDAKVLRLGLVSRDSRGFDMTKWHHLDCFPMNSESIPSAEEIKGFSSLKGSDKETIKNLLDTTDQSSEKVHQRDEAEEDELEERNPKKTKYSRPNEGAELDIAFSISDIKDKYKDATLLPKWKAFQTIIFLDRDDNLHDSGKIAAFDFDGCLANTSVKRVGPDAWSLMYPSIPEKLQGLYSDGYKLVIFTNESNIERWKNKRQVAVDSKIGRLNSFIKLVKVPIQVFIACGFDKSDGQSEDPFRKPKPGMWHIMEQHFNSGISIDMDQSFYVGDAAGREKDHSDADIKFAQHGLKPTKMARRTYTTELGCIACDDLSVLGAGKEGWLVGNPNLLTALDTHSLALANRSLVLVLEWSNEVYTATCRVKIRPDLSPIKAEYISAIEWLVFDDIRVLALGTSCGYLLIYSLGGVLIHKQIVNPGRVLKLRVRGTKRDLTQDSSSEEVCVVMPGVIARFDGSDIQSMLQRWFQERHAQFWDQRPKNRDPEDTGNSFGRLPYQLWNVSKYGSCADVAITGIMPPPLMEIHASSQRYYCAVTIGDDAVISAFRLSEDRSRSLVGTILSKVVPATFSTIASFSKMIWRNEQKSPKKQEAKPQPFARASPLTCLKDHPRKGEKLTLSPSGTLAAITDSLGRILLLDTQALVVVRLWKGYREASCLFMEMLVNRDTAASSSTYYEHVKSDYCLCLAIHAPRKGIVEVWQMRTGPRLLTVPCSKGSKILQPTYRFGSPLDSQSSYVPLEVFLLNGDSAQLSVLNRAHN
ncbi:hypothetical protein F0562_010566 [Nyssa sinensis]|uniref:PARP-type domain-containing protein n=1 Tax=Nyssa sinensis TaxID=561372 RepID=A0A5J4ZYV4_9ASTE|nr:hypothetical protein F0562_010566 [Nyssa sinensis]